jgi:hypothetical protein
MIIGRVGELVVEISIDLCLRSLGWGLPSDAQDSQRYIEDVNTKMASNNPSKRKPNSANIVE